MNKRYIFGKPVLKARPSASGQRSVFLIGAYPSALHVRWIHPKLARTLSAVAVDNEPEPFWTGNDEEEKIKSWKESLEWGAGWGDVQPCGLLNGSSGVWVRDRVLSPLKIKGSDTWMTDCLDNYYESVGARSRTQSNEVQEILKEYVIPAPSLDSHPGEEAVVTMAREQDQHSRISRELLEANPNLVITLGNAALRVIREIVDPAGSSLPIKLIPAMNLYGNTVAGSLDGRSQFLVLPLAHPAAPDVYQKAHDRWIEKKAEAIQNFQGRVRGVSPNDSDS